MKCPACQSSDVRASRFRPEDGLWRSIFYGAYRCRECGRRFERLTRAPLLAGIATGAVASSFALGFFAGGLRAERLAPAQAPRLDPEAPQVTTMRDLEDSAVLPAADLALAARAEAGDPKAQLQFGVAYLKGDGVERDPAAAIKWISKAADQGLVEAQYALGAMYHAGRGALQSFPLAFKWFELAAQQNHAEAQFSLGVMYRMGQGVPADKPKAYTWFNLAAAQGHERAREARDNLLPSLTPEQVLAAQRAAQEWRPATDRAVDGKAIAEEATSAGRK
jgi:hypothetical protein